MYHNQKQVMLKAFEILITAPQIALTILALVSIISFVADLRGIVYEG